MKFILRSLLLLSFANVLVLARGATFPADHALPGISMYSETRTNPPTRLFVADIDLKNPKIHLRVSPGGPDPDGAGKWETTLMEPTQIAAREKFDLVINGDFFDARFVKDAEGTNSGYRAGQWALVEGAAMTDGKAWSVSTHPRPCLAVHRDHSLTIEKLTQPSAGDWEVVGGNTILVRDGQVVPHQNKARNPRTAVGLDKSGNKLIILVVDGRKPGVAVGLSYNELAEEMVRLGCYQALNLDGGGSSVMAVRNPTTDKMKILNQPTDGRERAVANVLGITVDQP